MLFLNIRSSGLHHGVKSPYKYKGVLPLVR